MVIDLCASCGSEFVHHVPLRERLAYVVCKACGHCEKEPSDIPGSDSFEIAQTQYYGKDTSIFKAALSPFEDEVLAVRRAVVSRHLSPGASVLEVGPGSGRFLAWIKSIGLRATAVEHSPELSRQIETDLSIDVMVGEFENIALPSGAFDAFCSFHVIEHVRDPQRHLQVAFRAVRPGGVAFIATPNAGSWEHRIMDRLSPNYDSAHLRVFSPTSLRSAAEACGWQVIEVSTPEYSSGWLRVASKIVRRVRGEDEEETAGRYALQAASAMSRVSAALRICMMPLRFIQQRLGGGNELFVVFRKPDA